MIGKRERKRASWEKCHLFPLQCLRCKPWLQSFGKPEESEQWFAVNYALFEYLAQNNLHFFSFPFCKWCPRFLQWDNSTLYISLSTSRPRQSPWTAARAAPWGAPCSCWESTVAFRWAKSWKKGPPPNLPVFTVNPTAISCQHMHPACSPHLKVFQGHNIGMLSHCCDEDKLPRFKWEAEPNFYRIGEYHNFTWACKCVSYSPWEPEYSCASVYQTVSGWFQVPGEGHGVLVMGRLLFMPTVSTRKEKEYLSQLLEKGMAKAFLDRRTRFKFDAQFLAHLCFPQSNIFVSWKRSLSLLQQVWLRGQSTTEAAVRWQNWEERSILNKLVVLQELLSQTTCRTFWCLIQPLAISQGFQVSEHLQVVWVQISALRPQRKVALAKHLVGKGITWTCHPTSFQISWCHGLSVSADSFIAAVSTALKYLLFWWEWKANCLNLSTWWGLILAQTNTESHCCCA